MCKEQKNMKPKAKYVDTPVGSFSFPMNPRFLNKLDACKTNENLFMLVEHKGFINPDAFTEIVARGLGNEYKKWKNESKKT